jgi:hypothetical protein
MDCFVAEFIIGPAEGGTRWLLAMTSLKFHTYLRVLAALIARVLQKPIAPPIAEGAGNAGCPMHPQPRVQCEVSTRV